MSKYEPQVGDRVRRTFPDGTVMEGTIALVDALWALSEGGQYLYNSDLSEQTVLLERPVKLNTAPGAVYGAPDKLARMVVRVAGGWLGHTGEEDSHWYEDEDITRLITQAGWVEYNLDGSRKND